MDAYFYNSITVARVIHKLWYFIFLITANLNNNLFWLFVFLRYTVLLKYYCSFKAVPLYLKSISGTAEGNQSYEEQRSSELMIYSLFISQRFYRVETSCFFSRIPTEEYSGKSTYRK